MGADADKRNQADRETVIYMLHCGLKGDILRRVLQRHGVNVRIEQFPREQQFAYQMHLRKPSPDMVLIRGHFISLFHDLDKGRHIPHLVVSSKAKYGEGQPAFVHARGGYSEDEVREVYEEVALAIKEMVERRRKGSEST